MIGVLALSLSVAAGLTAGNVVGQSRASDTTSPLAIEPTPPQECEGMLISNNILGAGVIAGSMQNDWIIGSEGVDTIEGLGGDDCIEGKGSDDVIDGGPGNDVCIGGGGNDTFVACETEIQ